MDIDGKTANWEIHGVGITGIAGTDLGAGIAGTIALLSGIMAVAGTMVVAGIVGIVVTQETLQNPIKGHTVAEKEDHSHLR